MKNKFKTFVAIFIVSISLFSCSSNESKVTRVPLNNETTIFNEMSGSVFAAKFKFENFDSKSYELKFKHYLNGELIEETILAEKSENFEFYLDGTMPLFITEKNKNIPLYFSYAIAADNGSITRAINEISFLNADEFISVIQDDIILSDDTTTIELVRYISGAEAINMNGAIDFAKKDYQADVILVVLEPTK